MVKRGSIARLVKHAAWPIVGAATVLLALSQWEAPLAPANELSTAGATLGCSFVVAAIFDQVENAVIRGIGMSGAALFFLGGGYLLSDAASIADRATLANDARCLAIQRDMLSASPRKAQGPKLFEALGCRPQGDGSVYVPRVARAVAVAGPEHSGRNKHR